MAALALRHYQEKAVSAIWDGLAVADDNVLAVLPTGTGKALVICEFVRRALAEYPERGRSFFQGRVPAGPA